MPPGERRRRPRRPWPGWSGRCAADDRDPARLRVLGWEQQLAYRQLSNHADWIAPVRRRAARPTSALGAGEPRRQRRAVEPHPAPDRACPTGRSSRRRPPTPCGATTPRPSRRVRHPVGVPGGDPLPRDPDGPHPRQQHAPAPGARCSSSRAPGRPTATVATSTTTGTRSWPPAGTWRPPAARPTWTGRSSPTTTTTGYVTAVKAYAQNLLADPRAYDGYYQWQVYYRTVDGAVLLPEGYTTGGPIGPARPPTGVVSPAMSWWRRSDGDLVRDLPAQPARHALPHARTQRVRLLLRHRARPPPHRRLAAGVQRRPSRASRPTSSTSRLWGIRECMTRYPTMNRFVAGRSALPAPRDRVLLRGEAAAPGGLPDGRGQAHVPARRVVRRPGRGACRTRPAQDRFGGPQETDKELALLMRFPGIVRRMRPGRGQGGRPLRDAPPVLHRRRPDVRLGVRRPHGQLRDARGLPPPLRVRHHRASSASSAAR